MMRKIIIITLIVFINMLLLISCTEPKNKVSNKPNIIIVMADDQGWGDLSVHDNPYLKTPTIDTFKSESLSLERFFVSPVCGPTRASLLSGKWAISTGAWGVTNRDEVMRSETITIAEIFKEAGYNTGVFGKWHNGAQYPENPKGQGFDEFLGFTAGHWNNYFDTTLKNIDSKPIQTKGYITDVFTNAAIDFIKNNKKQPFLCYIPFNAPHSPFQVPDKYFDYYKNLGLDDKDACVYGMVENMDDNFSRILKILDEEQLAENTIVIFMSDNGPNGARYNGHMKGIKATNDEGGTRVPFFIRWPNKVKASREVDQITAHIDVLPTLMKMCGIKSKEKIIFDGKDISALILKDYNITEDRYIFSHWSGLKWNDIPGSVRNNQYRLVLKNTDTSLFDMKKDQYQKNNIYSENPDVSKNMLRAYAEWIKRVRKEGYERTPISVGYEKAKETLIEAHEFTLSEGLKYHGKEGWANDWINNWDATTDSIELEINIKTSGNYGFEFLYSCNPTQVGSIVELQIQGKSINQQVNKAFTGEELPSPDRIRRKEVYERTWNVLPVGDLFLEPGLSKLKIAAKTIAKDSVMNLKGLRIILKKS